MNSTYVEITSPDLPRQTHLGGTVPRPMICIVVLLHIFPSTTSQPRRLHAKLFYPNEFPSPSPPPSLLPVPFATAPRRMLAPKNSSRRFSVHPVGLRSFMNLSALLFTCNHQCFLLSLAVLLVV